MKLFRTTRRGYAYYVCTHRRWDLLPFFVRSEGLFRLRDHVTSAQVLSPNLRPPLLVGDRRSRVCLARGAPHPTSHQHSTAESSSSNRAQQQQPITTNNSRALLCFLCCLFFLVLLRVASNRRRRFAYKWNMEYKTRAEAHFCLFLKNVLTFYF